MAPHATHARVMEGLLQPGHLLLIMVISLIVFVPGKAEEIGRDLGRGVAEFRRALRDEGEDRSAS
ncbi:MAG: twin-arginine translocase TatA/TatE family subunit [Chloroflexi bacterium]|nr:MAG: twin-arginine translocase TatA/TatE family subunit [Chloroflexota bacterium]